MFVDNIITRDMPVKFPTQNCMTPSSSYCTLHIMGSIIQIIQMKSIFFDASTNYEGMSLKDNLIQSPDLTNSPVGVLSLFREETVTFIGDMDAMFYQVKLAAAEHDFLR